MITFTSLSPDDTEAIGAKIARLLPLKATVILLGDLGAGKTTLTKGIAEGLGVVPASEVTSPTFTLIHDYGDQGKLFHVDLYRVDEVEEARRLGLEELFEADAITLVEWGNKFPELIPPSAVTIQISALDEDGRRIEVTGLS